MHAIRVPLSRAEAFFGVCNCSQKQCLAGLSSGGEDSDEQIIRRGSKKAKQTKKDASLREAAEDSESGREAPAKVAKKRTYKPKKKRKDAPIYIAPEPYIVRFLLVQPHSNF